MPREGVGSGVLSTGRHSGALVRRRVAQLLGRVSLGLVVGGLMIGLTSIPAVNAGAAVTLKSNKVYAQAQLVKLSNLPSGWTKSGSTWVGTSGDNNSSSMLTMTQFPDLSTCLGTPPALSVTAAEASSPIFNSNDQNTSVVDVADVYSSASDAKADFPPLNNSKFANCFVKIEGSGITSVDQSNWPTGSTLGTPTASVGRLPKYGDQSGLVDVQVPVTLPNGQGTTNDFFIAVVIREGRSTAELQIDQGATLPSAALTESLAKAVTAKMKARPPGNSIIAA